MDVLDEPHCSAPTGDRVEAFEPGVEQLLALCGGADSLGCAHAAEQLGDNGRSRRGSPRRSRECFDIVLARDELTDRLERREHVGTQARAKDGCVSGSRGELVQEAGLADAGRRDHRHAAGRADERGELRDLRITSQSRRAQTAERALPRPLGMDADRSPRRNGLALAFQLELRQALELDRVGNRQGRRLANRHRLRLARRLQTGCGVHDIAGDRATVGARRPVHRLAARDSHAQAECARSESEASADALHGSHEREPRPHRALRVVVADARRAEHRHRRVADELLQLASVPRDRLPHRVEIRVLHERHVLGVELLRQRCEPDEVGEQDGDDAPLQGPLGSHYSGLWQTASTLLPSGSWTKAP